ncbi:phenoloxidase subunit 1-like [Anoplophora glabripennis]|uniref:phenoloxidase subunit 1-like n=1 Tax=Anoplophora glabripennis TaxID=217634 RepID=UPI000C7814B3|nr:phenoloxidase subunit 1-like [Anoplophora glabripennis]
MSDKSNFLLLFDRPQEPCFMPKGDKKCVFDVPLDYLPDKYKSVGTVVMSRFGQSEGEDQIPKIAVKQISIPPLDDVMKLRRDENFSLFIPKHRQIAARLIDIFLGIPE